MHILLVVIFFCCAFLMLQPAYAQAGTADLRTEVQVLLKNADDFQKKVEYYEKRRQQIFEDGRDIVALKKPLPTVDKIAREGALEYTKDQVKQFAKENGFDESFADGLVAPLSSIKDANDVAGNEEKWVYNYHKNLYRFSRAIEELFKEIADAIRELEEGNKELDAIEEQQNQASAGYRGNGGSPSGSSNAASNNDPFGMNSAFADTNATINNTFNNFNNSNRRSGLDQKLAATVSASNELEDNMQNAVDSSLASSVAGLATAAVIGTQQMLTVQAQARAAKAQAEAQARAAREANSRGGSTTGNGGSSGSGQKYVSGALYYQDEQKSFMNNNQPAQTGITIRYSNDAELQSQINSYKSQGYLFSPSSGSEF